METVELILSTLTLRAAFLTLVGTAVGILVGAIPGLTATMALALLIPFTYGQEIADATALLIGIYVGGMFGGAISAILFGIPGAPANAPTTLDGHPLARQGFARKALQMATLASAVGGLLSAFVLMFGATALSRVALAFSLPDYLALAAFGLTVVAGVSGHSLIRGLLSALLGLIVSTVGLDLLIPYPRYTFGVVNLLTGFPVVPVLIGLFAYSQMFRLILEGGREGAREKWVGDLGPHLTFKDVRECARTILRSSILGTVVGIIPAAGPNIAAFLGYNEARRASRNPERFGKGTLEGVAASEAANNAVPGGALVPLLTFGIPGDTVTALLLGAFTLHGYAPGPLLTREAPELVIPLYAMFVLANVALFLMGYLGVRPAAYLVERLDRQVLVSMVALFGVFGGFASTGQLYDALVTVAFGIIGYLLERAGVSIVPMSLTVILGPMIERYLRQSLIAAHGNVSALFFRPIAGSIWVATILVTWSVVRINRRIATAERDAMAATAK